MNLFQFERSVSSIEPTIVFRIFEYPVASSTILVTALLLLFVAFCYFGVRNFSLLPSAFQVLIEELYLGIESLVQQITAHKKMTEKLMPLIGTLLVYILISNIVGLIPGIMGFTYNGVPLLRTPTADINTTLGLAVGSMIVIHGTMIRQRGIFGYLGSFVKIKEVITGFRAGLGKGAMALVDMFIGLLDIIGEGAKVVSLSLRLFGNMYAGEVLATILLGLFAYGIPAVWLAMNLLSAVVQAIVFASLVTVFYSLAVKPEDK